MSNAARVKRLCGQRAVPGKPGTLGMKTDDIKKTIQEHVGKLAKDHPLRKEFTRGKKDRASLCMFLTKYRNGQALLNASSNSPPKPNKPPSPPKTTKKSWYEMTNGSGNSSSNNEGPQNANSGSENNIYNNGNSPPIRQMPTRTYQSRAREKDPLGNKTKFAGKLKGRVNRLLRKKGQTSQTSYGDLLKSVLTYNPKTEGPKRRALSAPARSANSGNSSANRKAAKSAVARRKSTSANAARRRRFDRRRKPKSPMKFSRNGNGRAPTSTRKQLIRATRKPRTRYNVAEGWAEATNRMIAGRRRAGEEGPELPINGPNYERMRAKFASNAIAKKPARRTPTPPKQGMNLTTLRGNSRTIQQEVALIRKKKAKNRTARDKKLLRIYEKSQKDEKERKKRKGPPNPSLRMMTGATNFVLEGTSPGGRSAASGRSGGRSGSRSGSGGSSRSSAGPNSGERMARLKAAAAAVRAAAGQTSEFKRPIKKTRKTSASPKAKPPSPPKGNSPRVDRVRKLMENMRSQRPAPPEVRRMVAANVQREPVTIRNVGGKGYYSMV